jgi:hypothetical protein
MYTWERRVPLIPQDAKELVEKDGLEIVVQSSHKRVFTDADYCQAGIEVADDLASCPIVFGIKEIPIPVLERGKTYVFFSHTIKGQAYNMPMLQQILDMGCTLIDYEKVTDEDGRRLIFFGNYAGLAGMIETLWAFGKRLAFEGIPNPFEGVKRTGTSPAGRKRFSTFFPWKRLLLENLRQRRHRTRSSSRWSSRRRIWSNNGRGITCSTSRSTTTIPNAIAASLNATSPTWISL